MQLKKKYQLRHCDNFDKQQKPTQDFVSRVGFYL
jgi:hypothetical protein